MAEAAAVPAGCEGLIALPYLAGERTPVFDPDARGLFAGLTLRHGRGHLFRAAYEGIGFGVRQILEMFDDAHTGRRTVAVGGGLRSPDLGAGGQRHHRPSAAGRRTGDRRQLR